MSDKLEPIGVPIPGGDGSHRIIWHLDDQGPWGLSEHHVVPGTERSCGGYLAWRGAGTYLGQPIQARHQLVAGGPGDEEHLTLSPSLLCRCGSHGFIRDGCWTDA